MNGFSERMYNCENEISQNNLFGDGYSIYFNE